MSRASNFIRLERADAMIRAGDHAKAVTEAEDLAAMKDADAIQIYNCACILSLASAEAPASTDRHAARAGELLRRAINMGFDDIPHLLADADLIPLQNRADYAELLWDLADTPTK